MQRWSYSKSRHHWKWWCMKVEVLGLPYLKAVRRFSLHP